MGSTPIIRVFPALAASAILWCCSTPTTLAERMQTVAEYMRKDMQNVEEELASIQPVLDDPDPSRQAMRDQKQHLTERLAGTKSLMESSLAATDGRGFQTALEQLTDIQIETERLVSLTMMVER